MIRLAIIGLLVFIIVASFAYVAGWLSPGLLTPARFADGFEQVNGIHDGFRLNHAKGVCISGSFQSNGKGTRLSKAAVFKAANLPVIGRFSLTGGNPYVADGPLVVRGLGLSFRPVGGQEWRTAMINLPVFPVKTPQAFYDQLFAMRPDPTTGQPDPARLKAFLAAHPDVVVARSIIGAHPFSSGFANTTFNGLNAFRFVNDAGDSTFVRWSMVPVDAFQLQDLSQPPNKDPNYLFDTLVQRLQHGPAQWHLMVTVAQPGDPTDDASIPWPPDRQRVDAGTLTIDHIEAEASGNCRDINFDPLALPSGISPSDDPLLSARSAVYSQSFTRREGEKKNPSMVKVPGPGKGE
jgi:catalase